MSSPSPLGPEEHAVKRIKVPSPDSCLELNNSPCIRLMSSLWVWETVSSHDEAMLHQGQLHPRPREDFSWCTTFCLWPGWSPSGVGSVSEKLACSLCKQEENDLRGSPLQQSINKLADVSTEHISPGVQFFGDYSPKTKTFVGCRSIWSISFNFSGCVFDRRLRAVQ